MTCEGVTHVISRTRPSHFTACNIEKLGMGLGMRLGMYWVCTGLVSVHWCVCTPALNTVNSVYGHNVHGEVEAQVNEHHGDTGGSC